jgi:DNA-binding NarL/FixJ family response regulator
MIKRKIIILDDEPLIPALIKDLIEEEPALEISEVVDNQADFFNRVQQDHFDVALIDVSLGKEGRGGMEVLRRLKEEQVNLPVIMLSAHDENEYGSMALQAGAKGYINKMHITTSLVKGCLKVIDNGFFVSGFNGDYLIERYKKTAA